MDNIFENAYFGKPYRTRDEGKCLFIRTFNSMMGHKYYKFLCTNSISKTEMFISCNEKGECVSHLGNFDIISEWQEEISEEELEKLAEQSNPYPSYDKSDICVAHTHDGFNEGFKVGIHKVLEYINNNKK